MYLAFLAFAVNIYQTKNILKFQSEKTHKTQSKHLKLKGYSKLFLLNC